MTLEESIENGKKLGKIALYFGCWNNCGHGLHDDKGRSLYYSSLYRPSDLPWNDGLMDTGLLINGKIKDIQSGKVYWTCGGLSFWYAFYWWDRSIDKRGKSNSGFYVRGFDYPDAQSAFDFACSKFPKVVSRQQFSLTLQGH